MMSEFILNPTQSRAPAILDVMGGVSDYSGSLCLSWPLEIAATCRITPLDEPIIIVRSDGATANGWNDSVEISLDEMARTFPHNAREKFMGKDAWALHAIGAFAMLQWQIGWLVPCGLTLEIESNIPMDAGVASSSALEVAVLSAIDRAFNLGMDGREIAQWAARVQNQVVGDAGEIAAPIAASLGRANQLIQIKCQPDEIEGFLALPDGIEFVGIASGAAPSDGVAPELAQGATMMGRALLARLVPEAMRGPNGEFYLANVSTDVWRALRNRIPEKLRGADFLRDRPNFDSATVDENTIYNVRLATEHPIYEADRAQRFARLLREMNENPNAREMLGRAAGELMIQSHFSYDHRYNLGCPETDLLVALAREAGVKNGIYGAKITGRGASGTVAILGDRQLNADLDAQIEQIAARYAEQSGKEPQIFRGSSDGSNTEL